MTPAHTNRLAGETSPYLLQHQHNPVDWFPWGEEAFDAARKLNKPIFLSVGYSTCYWCHVMERQCFESADIAKEMNDRFINIKVDREERPDVDQLYMMAVQVLTRQGGWPMSVFLTPDLRPFYGGTYFPPTDMHGRPGFVTVLRGIEDAFKNRHADVEQAAEQLVRILGELSEPQGPEAPLVIDQEYLESLIERSTSDYEPTYGGFGMAPKFPRETLLELLLTYTAGGAPSLDPESETSNLQSRILKQVRHALDAMMYGGVRDQLGGGFHRYSTDAKWLVPHFEIMLYDNAMLAWVYTEAYRQTEDRRYARTAREILDFVAREMTSPEGAFHTAFDAEVDGQEGLNYLWTRSEIEQVLGPDDAKRFNRIYGLDHGPNFADPHHPPPGGAPDKNILIVPDPAALEEQYDALRPLRDKLKAARDQRKQPLLDRKILTSWNALMIRAFAYAGQVLGEPSYVDRAERAAKYLFERHRNADGTLIRTRPQRPIAAFLDDYAFLIQALLAIDLAGGSEKWGERAEELAVLMRAQFEDAPATPQRAASVGATPASPLQDARGEGGFYFTARDAKDLIIRQKTASDSPLPSGNAVAAMVMMQLGGSNGQAVARRVLEVFAAQLDRGAEGMSSMVQAALEYVKRLSPLEICPSATRRQAQALDPAEQAAGDVVSITPSWQSPTELHLRLDIKPPFHIQSNDAAPGLLQTAIAVGGIESAKVVAVQYPPGRIKTLALAEGPLSVYAGGETITVTFDRAPNERRILIRLFYQPCDETACLPKVVKQFELTTAGQSS